MYSPQAQLLRLVHDYLCIMIDSIVGLERFTLMRCAARLLPPITIQTLPLGRARRMLSRILTTIY
jgi:hypothetical protein